jgi:hypothetical protein
VKGLKPMSTRLTHFSFLVGKTVHWVTQPTVGQLSAEICRSCRLNLNLSLNAIGGHATGRGEEQ